MTSASISQSRDRRRGGQPPDQGGEDAGNHGQISERPALARRRDPLAPIPWRIPVGRDCVRRVTQQMVTHRA